MAALPMELCFAARCAGTPAGRAPTRTRRAGAAGGTTVRCAATAPAPMGEKTEYRDGPLERAFMGLFARKMEKYASSKRKQPSPSPEKKAVWDWDYDSFVDVSRRVMVGRTRAQQQEAVREVLLSMLPPGAPEQFRKLFPPTRWACEFNAALTVPFFHWLVGPSEVVEVEVNGVKQKSGVRGDVRQHVQDPHAGLLHQRVWAPPHHESKFRRHELRDDLRSGATHLGRGPSLKATLLSQPLLHFNALRPGLSQTSGVVDEELMGPS